MPTDSQVTTQETTLRAQHGQSDGRAAAGPDVADGLPQAELLDVCRHPSLVALRLVQHQPVRHLHVALTSLKPLQRHHDPLEAPLSSPVAADRIEGSLPVGTCGRYVRKMNQIYLQVRAVSLSGSTLTNVSNADIAKSNFSYCNRSAASERQNVTYCNRDPRLFH